MTRKGVQNSDDNSNDDDLCVAGILNKEVKDNSKSIIPTLCKSDGNGYGNDDSGSNNDH